MEIETTVSKAALLRFATNIDCTGPERDKLDVLAKKIGEQIEEAVAEAGGQLLPDGGFAFPAAAKLDHPVTLDLTFADANNLTICCDRITWPYSRLVGPLHPLRPIIADLRHTDLPAWVKEAEVMQTWESLPEEQRQRILARKE